MDKTRINATSYSLNAMEIHNSRFDGEFKRFAEEISQHSFFNDHRVFSTNEIRRMRDISFVLVFVITIMSAYFNREDELENYLERYNDEFELKNELGNNITKVFKFIDECNFGPRERVWKKSDLLNLLVEIYHSIILRSLELDPHDVGEKLKRFYIKVDHYPDLDEDEATPEELKDISEYSKAASQATNDRSSRIKRGEIIQKIISGKEIYEETSEFR